MTIDVTYVPAHRPCMTSRAVAQLVKAPTLRYLVREDRGSTPGTEGLNQTILPGSAKRGATYNSSLRMNVTGSYSKLGYGSCSTLAGMQRVGRGYFSVFPL